MCPNSRAEKTLFLSYPILELIWNEVCYDFER